MFAEAIEAEEDDGRTSHLMLEQEQSAELIRAIIEQLDGDMRSLLTIRGPGDSHLAIGGSSRSGLVVYATFDNESFWQLCDADQTRTDPIEVVAGRTVSEFPRRHVVALSDAVEAALAFTESGVLAEELRWERS